MFSDDGKSLVDFADVQCPYVDSICQRVSLLNGLTLPPPV